MLSQASNIQCKDTAYRGIQRYYHPDWNIEALNIQRSKIKDKEYTDLNIQGHSIYFLYGEDENGNLKVYVGRSSETKDNNPVFTRLHQHKISNTEYYRDIWESVIAISFKNLSFDEMRHLENYFFKALLSKVKLNKTEPDTDKYEYNSISHKVEYIKSFVTYILKENVFKSEKKQEAPKDVPRLTYTQEEKDNEGKRLVDKDFETITEVQTPNDIIEKMLDMLPQQVWNPNTKFLDPACKSGEFLKAIFNRLLVSPLYDEINFPNEVVKVLHILSEQIYGVALTETSYNLALKNINKKANIVKIDNFSYIIVKFSEIEMLTTQLNQEKSSGSTKKIRTIEKKINANKNELLRLNVTESTIKEFLSHKFGEKEMKFDVIIGNPPYQENTGGGLNESGGAPLFDKFISTSIDVANHKVCLVTPSKWMSGNKPNFVYIRNKLVANRHLRKMVDYFNPKDLFPNLQIAGGVSYFLYDKDYSGDCEFTTIMNTEKAKINYISNRKLNVADIIPRHAVAENIIRKMGKIDTLSNHIHKDLWKIPTDFVGKNKIKVSDTDIKVVTPRGDYYVDANYIDKMYIDTYKVMFTRAVNGSTFYINSSKTLLSSIRVLGPGEICNASYMAVMGINRKEYAENIALYLQTKFVRFLLLQTLFGIGLTSDRFQYIPVLDFSKQWTDSMLYQKYNLSEEEIDFIENIIKSISITQDQKIAEPHLNEQVLQANIINKLINKQD